MLGREYFLGLEAEYPWALDVWGVPHITLWEVDSNLSQNEATTTCNRDGTD